MNKDLDFDSLVEVLEDLEEEVECKECFDLFPKAQCLKQDVGYICPTCGKLKMQKPAEYSVFDTYDQEFPEITDYAPETVKDYDQEPKIEDALADLIKDEYEAIDGYEVADEKIQHASIPEDKKDDILDTLEHIKEEEKEHIDELKELAGEGDSEEESEDDKEETKESVVQEKLDIDFSNCIDSSDMETWGVEPVGEGTYKAVLLKRYEDVPFRGGRDEIEKVESEMFDLGGLFVFHFGKDGLPFLGRWDPELLRSLGNCEIIFDDERYDQACERTLNRSFEESAEKFDDFDLGPQSDELVPIDYENSLRTLEEDIELNEAEVGIFRKLADRVSNKAAELGRKYTKAHVNIDELFPGGYYINITGATEDQLKDPNGKSYQNRPINPPLVNAEKEAKNISKILGQKPIVTLMARDEDKEGNPVNIDDPQMAKLLKSIKRSDIDGWWLDQYRGGRSVRSNIKTINDKLKQLEVAYSNVSDVEDEDKIVQASELRANLIKQLGEKLEAEGYTKDSYQAYSQAFDKVVAEIKALDKAALKTYDIEAKKAELEELLEEVSGLEDPGEDPVEDLKNQVLEILGEKKDAAPYTPESFKTYSTEWDKTKAIVDRATNEKQFKALLRDLPAHMEKVNALLKEKAGGSDTPVEEPVEEPAEEEEDLTLQKKLATKALNKGIEKPDAYTEESYADYKESLEDLLTKLQGYTKVAQVKAFIAKIPNLLEQLKELLDPKEDEIPDEVIPEGETPEELEGAKKAAHEKLGTPIEGEGYTTESYDKYIEAHDNIIDEIDACETVAEVEAIDIDKKKAEAEGLLEKVAEEPEVNLDELKAQIKEALGPKKDAEPYTEESYAKYSEAYDDTVAQIDKAETEEDIPVTLESVEQHREYLEQNLVEKPKDETPEEEEPEEEPEAEATPAKSKLTSNQIADIVRSVFQNYGKTPEKKVINRIKELLKKKLGESLGTEEEIRKLITEALETGKIGEDLITSEDTEKAITETFERTPEAMNASAIQSMNRDTVSKVQSAVKNINQMFSVFEDTNLENLKEEYHKYANQAELKAMEDLETIIEDAKNDALGLMHGWGIDIRESDAQGWMSGNKEYTYQFMLDCEGIDEDEEEDVQDQLQSIVENAVLSQYNLPPELSKISVSVMLPDPDIAYDDWDDEGLQDVKRASLLVDVTFARNLI